MAVLKSKKKFWGSILAALLLGAALLSVNASQKDRILFSHQKHVEELGLECSTCHAGADSSLRGTDNLLPSMETCFQCHDGESAPNTCTLCHSNPDEAGVAPRILTYSPKFPHAVHLKSGEDCLVCHVGVEKDSLGVARYLPKMTQCQRCHEQKRASDPLNCQVCHLSGKDLRLVSHKLEWAHGHQFEAESNPAECSQCHANNYCQDCHEGRDLTHRTHPLNFEWNHAIEAKMNKTQCLACHQDEIECIQCHREKNVLPASHNRLDWVNRLDGGQHRIEAEVDLESCVACHGNYKTFPTCFRCHSKSTKEE
jgi:hypothetical protein